MKFQVCSEKPESQKHVTKFTHSSLKYAVVLVQCFALFPVENILSNNPTVIFFSWRSWKVVYSLVSLLGESFLSVMSIFDTICNGFTLERITRILFHVNAVITTILYFVLAKNWSRLINIWAVMDLKMEKNYGYPDSVNRRLRYIAATIITLALAEHTLGLSFQVKTTYNSCNNTFSAKMYYRTIFPYIFNYINYSVCMAILVQVTIILSTMKWSFNDLIIILICTTMIERFQQITNRLKFYSKIKFQGFSWKEIREDYNRVCNLCNVLDASVSGILVLSYFINLSFIIVQLYNSLRFKPNGNIEIIYFFYSLGYLLFRSLVVSFRASQINEESKAPTSILHSVASSDYNAEVQRFLFQISFDNVALTGCKMFKVTRGLILNIAAAILTYELVLMQCNNTKM